MKKLFNLTFDQITIYRVLHICVGVVYLCALIPLFWQIEPLIGTQGLQPFTDLIDRAVKAQGGFCAFLQFPSLLHFFPSNVALYCLVLTGCIGAVLLFFKKTGFYGALLAWISFVSLTTVGGEFFVIIIDLFLAEVGFLVLLSTWFVSRNRPVPVLLHLAFVLLNFRLWFSMGMNKFYFPDATWASGTFFNYFFQAQPMPTPVAWFVHHFPVAVKWLGIPLMFIGEIIIPFFVFGGKKMRVIAFFTFLLISLLIELTGNYGYFNVLSIAVAVILLSNHNILQQLVDSIKQKNIFRFPAVIIVLVTVQISYQLLYAVKLFEGEQYSYQNHFNTVFARYVKEHNYSNRLVEICRLPCYWRVCNPYGVFRGIPAYHAEVRIESSIDSVHWKDYRFNYMPSALTGYLGFYAPYYPRIDHLMFYEGINARSGYENTLNQYTIQHSWFNNFIKQLFDNKAPLHLLKNASQQEVSPKLVKLSLYRLKFSESNLNGYWVADSLLETKHYTPQNIDESSQIFSDEAFRKIIGP